MSLTKLRVLHSECARCSWSQLQHYSGRGSRLGPVRKLAVYSRQRVHFGMCSIAGIIQILGLLKCCVLSQASSVNISASGYIWLGTPTSVITASGLSICVPDNNASGAAGGTFGGPGGLPACSDLGASISNIQPVGWYPNDSFRTFVFLYPSG
jgi:hypothetical protein